MIDRLVGMVMQYLLRGHYRNMWCAVWSFAARKGEVPDVQ